MLFRIQLNLNLVLIISQLNLQGNIKTDKNKCAAIRANRVELHHSVWFLGHQIIHVWPASCIPHLLFCITEKQLIIFSASLCSGNFNPIQKGKVAEGWVTEAAPPVWPAGRFIWLVSAHSRWKLWTSAQRYSSHPLLSSPLFFFFFGIHRELQCLSEARCHGAMQTAHKDKIALLYFSVCRLHL